MGGSGSRRSWIVALLALLAGFAAAGRLMPAVRWFLRQQSERVVEEAGRRGIKFPTFKLTRRRALIHRLTHEPEILEAAERYADESGVSMASTMARVERYAREIVPSFNAFLYFRIGIPLADWVSRSLYDVHVVSNEGLTAVDESSNEDASVVELLTCLVQEWLAAALTRHRPRSATSRSSRGRSS